MGGRALCEEKVLQKGRTMGYAPLLEPARGKVGEGNKRVIVLAGPTASGKTALSLLIAQKLLGEIVSADSMQVYRGMDIGTAKATKEEQALIPHHMLDIRNVDEPFNAVDYYYEARGVCDQILARNRVPIIVGGSGFYIRTLLYGPPGGPPSLPKVREALQQEMEEKGVGILYERLKSLDPTYAESISQHDRQKIVRGLEIIALTSERVSSLDWGLQRSAPKNYQFFCWFLTRPRSLLYQRIEKRCQWMLERGLLDEVKELVYKGIQKNSTASQAIGYRHCLDYLATCQTASDYAAMVERFKIDSRRYSKRQFTWFKKEPGFRWFNVEEHDPESIATLIIENYNVR